MIHPIHFEIKQVEVTRTEPITVPYSSGQVFHEKEHIPDDEKEQHYPLQNTRPLYVYGYMDPNNNQQTNFPCHARLTTLFDPEYK